MLSNLKSMIKEENCTSPIAHPKLMFHLKLEKHSHIILFRFFFYPEKVNKCPIIIF